MECPKCKTEMRIKVDGIWYCPDCQYAFTDNDALRDRISELEAEKERLREQVAKEKWIPVSERLPEKPGQYETRRRDGQQTIIQVMIWHQDEYFLAGLIRYFPETTPGDFAWRPLPAPRRQL